MKTATKRIRNMGFLKHATAVATVVGIIFVSHPGQAQNRDWTDGIFNCSVEVTEAGPWYLYWQWGLWKELDVRFTSSRFPAQNVAYHCSATRTATQGNENYTYLCTRVQGSVGKTSDKLEFQSGTSKSQACQSVFLTMGLGIKQ